MKGTALNSAHSEQIESVLDRFGVDVDSGLSSDEAASRLSRLGPNTLVLQPGRPAWRIFLGQFSSIVVWLLAVAAGVSALTGTPVEAAAIVAVLVLNALIGFLIEWQAGRALEALRRASRTTARVRRSGREEIIDAERLVGGDIIVLTAGDHVPADSRLVEAVNLRADESTLTGESTPVEKSIAVVESSAPLADRSSMVYLGTSILAGRAIGLVTAVGKDTEIGRIAELLERAPEKQTPLERRLSDLGRRLVYLVLAIAAVVLLAGFLRGDDPWLMAKVSISLAVAAVPEGLPAVTTLILALGVLRMARASAIVRHLVAVETLGSTTVICTDKTGTLTENRMTVREIFLANGKTLTLDGECTPRSDDEADRLLRVAALCSEATVRDDSTEVLGDPTETALLVAARELGVDIHHERRRHLRVSETPFEAAAKKMSAVFETGDHNCIAMIKGAPSVVLQACDYFLDASGNAVRMTDDLRERFHKVNDAMAHRALRVLAFADKCGDEATDDTEGGYTFLGFAGMTDPPRPEVPEAIRRTKEAGIRVVMLTGDQVLTAKAIARELNISQNHDVFALHSRDVADTDDARLADLARSAHVFARVTPEDKLRIVRALQQSGEIVAVTGDGVNDAPALKQADIGVAMGMRGTDVAKESADIVLTDDNFSTIVRAVEGGRTIYSNIIKFVHLLFSHNLGEVLVIFVAIIASLPLPLLPLQILWINLVTDIFPAFALAVEPATKETMLRRPRSPKESFLSARFMALIGWQGAMLAAITLAAYAWALNTYGEGAHARTIALLSLVGVELGHLFNCRSRTRSTFGAFFSNPYVFVASAIVIALQLLAVFNPFLSKLLGLETPNANDWIVVGFSVAIPVVIVETWKAIVRRSRDHAPST